VGMQGLTGIGNSNDCEHYSQHKVLYILADSHLFMRHKTAAKVGQNVENDKKLRISIVTFWQNFHFGSKFDHI
jgi:hypothetical protein